MSELMMYHVLPADGSRWVARGTPRHIQGYSPPGAPRWGTAWKRGAMVFLLAFAAALPVSAGAYGSDITFELSTTGGVWNLPALSPGQAVYVPGIHQVTVVSEETWEVVVSARLVGGGFGAAPRSQVWLGVSRHGGGGEALGERSEFESPKPAGEGVEWASLASEGIELVHRGGATGPAGETLLFDLEIHPSWEDPPGAVFRVELTTTVSAGETAVAAYVEPATIVEGEKGPITFWFRSGAIGAPQEADELLGEVRSFSVRSSGVTVEVWRGDVELIARLTGIAAGSGEAMEEVGWSRIVWDSLPDGGLMPGAYRFRITDDTGRLLGSGVFRVEPQPARGSVAALAVGFGDVLSVPGLQGPLAFESGDLRKTLVFPAIRSVVAGDAKPPGEPSAWSVTLINPESLSLFEAQLEVCLSRGWSFYGVSAPFLQGKGESFDSACRTFLLGTINARSRKRLELSLVYWDSATGSAWEPGLSFPGFPQRRDHLTLRLTGALEPGGVRGLVHEARVPLLAAVDPLLLSPFKVSGKVYVDVNGSRAYEPGEPLVSGAKVMIDGREVATTNRRGEYRVELQEPPQVIWVQSERGNSAPVSLSSAGVWVEAGTVDLALSPWDPKEEESGISTGSEGPVGTSNPATDVRGYALVAARVDAQEGPGVAAAGVRAGVTSPALEATLELQAGGDLAGVLATHGERDRGLQHEASLSVALSREGLRLALDHESGLARQVRLGALRPSKPVESATRARLDLVLEADPARSPVSPLAPPGLGVLFPGLYQSRWEVAAERGRATGDVWSCTLDSAAVAHVGSSSRIAAGVTETAHRRVEPNGIKEATATQLTLEADGSLMLFGSRTPYRATLVGGEKRELSPSCGLSPFDGWKWQAILAPPTGPVVQGVEWAGMAWREKGKTSNVEGQSVFWGRAQEVAFSLRPVEAGKERLNITAAIQWQAIPEAGGNVSGERMRFGGRFQTRIAATHDLRLELGALQLSKVNSPAHLERGDGRLALSWRVVRGSFRPWVSYSVFSPRGVTESSREYGFSLNRELRLPWIGDTVDTSFRLSRAMDPDDVKDSFRLDVRTGEFSARYEWKGSAGLSAAEGGEGENDEQELSGGVIFLPGAYEKVDWKLSLGSNTAGGSGNWSLVIEGKSTPAEAQLSGTFLLGGRWTAGEERSPGGGSNHVEHWAGRWEAGLGRSLLGRNGVEEQFITGVVRLAIKRAAWTVKGEAMRKTGLHDHRLEHAGYQVTLERVVAEGWAIEAAYGISSSLDKAKTARYRLGVEKLIDREGSVALGVGLVWEQGQSPATARGPRLEASLTAPVLW